MERGKATGNLFQPSFKMLYKYFAIYIRIQGPCCDSVRVYIDEAQNYFCSIHPNDPPPCGKVLERLFIHFLVSREFYERLSTRFLCLIMRSLGSSVSDDEKLFYFTGNSSCWFLRSPPE